MIKAPKMARTSLWIVAYIKPEEVEGELESVFTWLETIFTSPTEALEEGLAQLGEEEEMKLIQVILDKDSPTRWADTLLQRLEEESDLSSPPVASALDLMKESVRDFYPELVDDLPEDGDGLLGEKERK